MYEIIICDDDSAFASALSSTLSRFFGERDADCNITCYPDPSLTLSALDRGDPCDLLFLDILFGEEKGIRFGKLLRERNLDLDLVLMSSSERYAVDGYDVRPLHYLLKPLRPEQLESVLCQFLERHAPQMLSLTTPLGDVRLPVADALYFEVYNHVVELHRLDGSESSWRGTLQELERELPAGRFVRVHRSYLVNLEHIAVLSRDRLRLTSGDVIPLGRSDYSGIQMALAAFDRRRPPV